jgi:hypothetical protein
METAKIFYDNFLGNIIISDILPKTVLEKMPVSALAI